MGTCSATCSTTHFTKSTSDRRTACRYATTATASLPMLGLGWENYIKQGDKDQEELTAGGSIGAGLRDRTRWEVMIPIQAVFKHIGGQINDKNDPTMRVRTLSI